MKLDHIDYVLVGSALLAFTMGAFFNKVRAQDHHHKHHPEYNKWLQPGGKAGCCNARFNEKGEEVGDCEATSFELRRNEKGDLEWWAYVPIIKQTLLVPETKIIREKNPDQTGREGHVCYSLTSGFLCAVPPTGSL